MPWASTTTHTSEFNAADNYTMKKIIVTFSAELKITKGNFQNLPALNYFNKYFTQYDRYGTKIVQIMKHISSTDLLYKFQLSFVFVFNY